MIHERFVERFLGLARADPRPPLGLGLERHRAGSPRDNPRAGFVGDPDAGLYCHPTIVDGVTADDDIYRTETFGPIVGVASFGDFDEAIELANGHGYGLSSAIYTNDPQSAFRFRAARQRGHGVASTTRPPAPRRTCPSAATASPATAAASPGIWVLDQFTRWQSINWDYAGKLQKAQMDVAELTGDPGFRLAWD